MLNYTIKYNNLTPEKRLPNEYQEVEYIESSGTQYIDTNFQYTQTTGKVIVKYIPTAIGSAYSTYRLGGAFNGSNRSFIMYNAYGTVYAGLGGSDYNTSLATVVNNMYEATCNITTALSYTYTLKNLTSNSTSTYNGTYTGSIATSKNYLIFCNNENGTPGDYGKYKLYYYKMWETGTLVRNFIPCYRKSDTKPGLYDLVNNEFYTNSGTGDFTYGSEIDYNYIYKSTEAVSSLPIVYNNQTITTLTEPTTILLPIKEKYCNSNIQIGNIILPTNGKCGRDNVTVITEDGLPTGFWYGDGTLNAVEGGYQSNGVALYGQKGTDTPVAIDAGSTSYGWSGNRLCTNGSNNNAIDTNMNGVTWDNSSSFYAGAAGTNTDAWTIDATNEPYQVRLDFGYGAYTTGIYIGAVKLCINGTYYTLKESVDNGLIEPLVILWSAATNGNYYMSSMTNIYNGGNAGSGSYPHPMIYFQLKKGNIITYIQFYANQARGSSSYNDGFWGNAVKASKYRLLINKTEN